MKNYFRYAFSRYPYWLSVFSVLIGIIGILPMCSYLAFVLVVLCFIFSFLIPFISALSKRKYKLKTIGKTKLSISFGNILDKDCFLITTNRNFDVKPDGVYISPDSLLGKFVEKYYPNNVSELERLIKEQLPQDSNNQIKPIAYGKTIQINQENKIIYFMAFTDRKKNNQPEDFYIKSVQGFLKEINNANHGRTIYIPLLGDNNNLSRTGFSESKQALKSLITMINQFEIADQRSELKIEIVVLPEKRAELIDTIAFYS